MTGDKQTIPLKIDALSEPGTYAVTRQWPEKGRWVLEFVAKDQGRITSTLVAAGPGGVERDTAKMGMHEPVPEEVAAMLAGGPATNGGQGCGPQLMQEAVRLSPRMLAATSPSTESELGRRGIGARSIAGQPDSVWRTLHSVCASGAWHSAGARSLWRGRGPGAGRFCHGVSEDCDTARTQSVSQAGWQRLRGTARASFIVRRFNRRQPTPKQPAKRRVSETTEPEANALAVLQMIQMLPDAYRETLVLRFVEGLTGPEIAQRTGLTADSVRVNLHRGTKMLREKWKGPEQV